MGRARVASLVFDCASLFVLLARVSDRAGLVVRERRPKQQWTRLRQREGPPG